MPASLYRLVGKPHHAEVSESVKAAEGVNVVNEPAVSVNVESPVVVIAATTPDAMVNNNVAEDVSAVDSSTPPAVTSELTVAKTPTASLPTWDPNWSKTQLLAVASKLGLPVTNLSTKTEIIKALTAATAS